MSKSLTGSNLDAADLGAVVAAAPGVITSEFNHYDRLPTPHRELIAARAAEDRSSTRPVLAGSALRPVRVARLQVPPAGPAARRRCSQPAGEQPHPLRRLDRNAGLGIRRPAGRTAALRPLDTAGEGRARPGGRLPAGSTAGLRTLRDSDAGMARVRHGMRCAQRDVHRLDEAACPPLAPGPGPVPRWPHGLGDRHEVRDLLHAATAPGTDSTDHVIRRSPVTITAHALNLGEPLAGVLAAVTGTHSRAGRPPG